MHGDTRGWLPIGELPAEAPPYRPSWLHATLLVVVLSGIYASGPGVQWWHARQAVDLSLVADTCYTDPLVAEPTTVAVLPVSGAGDPSYNGIYRRGDGYGGKPSYTNGSRWLWWYLNTWVLSPLPEVLTSGYRGSLGAELPGGTWERNGSPGPTPSVSLFPGA